MESDIRQRHLFGVILGARNGGNYRRILGPVFIRVPTISDHALGNPRCLGLVNITRKYYYERCFWRISDSTEVGGTRGIDSRIELVYDAFGGVLLFSAEFRRKAGNLKHATNTAAASLESTPRCERSDS